MADVTAPFSCPCPLHVFRLYHTLTRAGLSFALHYLHNASGASLPRPCPLASHHCLPSTLGAGYGGIRRCMRCHQQLAPAH
eukprot:1588947-Amphidinium_carterae.2